MAAPLRYTLILLAWGAMAAIYLPLFPAAGELVGAARSPAHWRALFADPQLGQALAATLVSTLLSVGGALLIALTIVAALWPSARWRRLAPVCRCCWRCPISPWRRRRCCCSPKGAGSGSGCRF
ncbi:ABC transporter permease [Klebsiella pneumoniae]|nr:ABC transporter permease [Klebsiella pneumoniae]